MRAIVFDAYGEPDVLHVAEVPEPHAGPGQLRVRVRAAGVNPFDWKVRRGLMVEQMPLKLPWTPGAEAAGVVDEVGPDAGGARVGDEVFGDTAGAGYAEVVLLDTWAVKPASLAWEEAAGFPTAVQTAVRTLDELGVTDGMTLVVHGAAGAVGQAVVQLARARGARVIGTASPNGHDAVRALGAEVTTYGEGLPERVAALAPGGADRALDVAGHGALADLIAITGDARRVLTISDFEGAARHGVRASTGGPRTSAPLELAAALSAEGRFRLPVARTFPFEEAAAAHALSEEGHAGGKIVLVP